LRILRKVRGLLATAESSEFEAEVEAFAAKANSMIAQYEIEPMLLDFPRESLKVAVVMSEMQRVKEWLVAYEEEPETWPTKTVEWGQLLDEYDSILEVAADVLDMPLKKLPYGCVRHFRPEERAKIERSIQERVSQKKEGSVREVFWATQGASDAQGDGR
jgi:light-regulated signal transduction histidine kinase (bacteriophytochrome)